MNDLEQDVRESLLSLLREILDGPPDVAFVLNRGDRGLLTALDALDAGAASAQPGGRSSVAAHVDHLRYGLHLLNRWASGEDPWADADFAASWRRQQVGEDEWRALRHALRDEARAWVTAVGQPRRREDAALTETLASVVHLAYHLGAIRQIAPASSGPPARD